MKKDFTEKMKKNLVDMRNDILNTLKGRNEDLMKLGENVGEGDDADIASDTIDVTLFNSLGEQDQNNLTLIERALDRIRNNTYGICLGCGKPIPEARLEFIPFAALCVECQEKEERRSR